VEEMLLTDLEVIWPAPTTPDERKPASISIFGNVLDTGSTADPQFNLSG
jgi:hypothetical protein